MDATEAAVFAERATFLLAETMGKQKAHALVEQALAKGGSFVEALGQLEKELADSGSLLGYSPKFVDRLLASLKR
jgi:3-carboxy-cis,cis-muconate cycloisomerase